MKCRILGRTGLKVSELGIGGHEYRRMQNTGDLREKLSSEEFDQTQADRNRLVGRAVDAGVNYFDTTIPEEAESLGRALKSVGRREDVHVAAMLVSSFTKMLEGRQPEWRGVIREAVEERLRLLQTDYIDVFNIHAPEKSYSRERLEAAVDVLEGLRAKGMVRWVGVSSHEPTLVAELMRKYDCFDSVMVRYNYHNQEAREVLFPLAKALEVGVVVMKPLSWPHYGIPFMRFGPDEVKGGRSALAQMSLRWILESPEVTTIVPGINDEAELEEDLAAVAREGEIMEELLDQCLRTALGSEGRERLTAMLEDPAPDIRRYAETALQRS